MELQELQREAERLNPEKQRKLIRFLVTLDLRRDEGSVRNRSAVLTTKTQRDGYD